MLKARIIVLLSGLVLPYAARLPRGSEWLHQYTDQAPMAWLFLGACNAVAWSAILAVSFLYRRPSSLLAPSLPGFGFLAWAHYSLDLAADAQAAIALIFIPVFALAPILVGAAIGYLIDRRAGSQGVA
ncbi:membrane protein [Lysobacter maris]|uniref:Membrane protein n=2 Tax=Marilutibacter maris TaxID=1605891 RepID=A0A2U9T8N9_9GAMM|nr:membrane protein [Lysobacter maris]